MNEWSNKEYFIIKRIPYEYDQLPDYFDVIGGFTRLLKAIKTFYDIEEASKMIRVIKAFGTESLNYTYEIVRI